MIESNVKKDLEHKIDLYINGKLNKEQVDELWTELIQDGYYLDYTKSVANIKAVIEKQQSKNQTTPVYQLRKVINYGAAAAIAIIIGVIGVLNYSGTNNPLEIAPQEQLDLGGIRGSGEDIPTSNIDAIKEAIQLALNGNVEQAISLLETELNKSENSERIAEMSLTLGSIQYNYGEYNSALENFERVVNQSSIDNETLEKGYWYLGNAYFQLDRLQEAESAFQKTFELNGGFSRLAKSYLEALKKR
tara:strand:- start:3289 stop:4029 length:741 start_codon:yes stop_codon:yes gene_type:complete